MLSYAFSIEDEELFEEAAALLVRAAMAMISARQRGALKQIQRHRRRPAEPTPMPGEGPLARIWHLMPDNPMEIPGGFLLPERLQAELGVFILELAVKGPQRV
jgi:hypothetical protein